MKESQKVTSLTFYNFKDPLNIKHQPPNFQPMEPRRRISEYPEIFFNLFSRPFGLHCHTIKIYRFDILEVNNIMMKKQNSDTFLTKFQRFVFSPMFTYQVKQLSPPGMSRYSLSDSHR